MTLCSFVVLPALQGEQVVEMAEICRRFETEEEKVLPFFQTEADTDGDVAKARETMQLLHVPPELKPVRVVLIFGERAAQTKFQVNAISPNTLKCAELPAFQHFPRFLANIIGSTAASLWLPEPHLLFLLRPDLGASHTLQLQL